MRGWRSVLAAACLACLPASATAQAGDADARLEQAHERLLREKGLQFERPTEAAEIEKTKTGKAWRAPRVRLPGSNPLTGTLEALGPIARVIFWGGIGLALAGFLWFVARRLMLARRGGGEDASDKKVDDVLTPDRPEERIARSRLDEADRLAAEGRYDEAVHLLLFKSIEDVETARKARLSRSLTAREIVSLDELSARARGALAPITALVERAVFAGRSLVAGDYQAARAAYQDFAFGADPKAQGA